MLHDRSAAAVDLATQIADAAGVPVSFDLVPHWIDDSQGPQSARRAGPHSAATRLRRLSDLELIAASWVHWHHRSKLMHQLGCIPGRGRVNEYKPVTANRPSAHHRVCMKPRQASRCRRVRCAAQCGPSQRAAAGRVPRVPEDPA